MDPYSLRNRLGEKQFDILAPEQYLGKLRVVADPSALPEARKQAKEDLLNAHLRLIAKTIHRVLDATRAKGGYAGPRDGIGIEERSDLFNSMAGYVHGELTKMVADAAEHDCKLSTVIVDRVAKRVLDKIKTATAKKRTADFDSAELLDQLVAGNEPFTVLEGLLQNEAYTEYRAAVDELPETERLVFQALIYGFETEQDLTVAQIARALGIPETTARSAFARAREKFQRRFPRGVNGETS